MTKAVSNRDIFKQCYYGESSCLTITQRPDDVFDNKYEIYRRKSNDTNHIEKRRVGRGL